MINTKHNILLLLLLVACCSTALYFILSPKEEAAITFSASNGVYTQGGSTVVNLPTYKPQGRTAMTAPAVSSSTALPLVNSGAHNFQVHHSNMLVHSVGGGMEQGVASTYASSAPQHIQHTANYHHALTARTPSMAQNYQPRMLAYNQPTVQRAPGVLEPGGEGEGSSVWQGWLDQYYGSGYSTGDLSGLEAWWNSTYGGGYTPDIWTDFYDWAQSTQVPLPDGLLFSLLLITLYAIRRRLEVKG